MTHKWWAPSIALLSTLALAEHGDREGQLDRRSSAADLQPQVRSVFQKKCQTCHDGDGKFNDQGLPNDESRLEVLAALNHEPGVRPMPPAAKPQLTEEEKGVINAWAGTDPKKSTQDLCSGKGVRPSSEVIKGIFSDRCVACHGKLSFNPTSLLRPAHEQFLRNDGSLDLSILGDMSEIEPYEMPKGKTSIPRILDALTNYTMPPRGELPILNRPSDSLFPQVGTPHMTAAERQYLIQVLNARVGRENCPPTQFVSVSLSATSGPALFSFAEAAEQCERRGMRVPTHKQVQAAREKVEAAVQSGSCVWTATFDADPIQKKRALRKTLTLQRDGTISFGREIEKNKCQALCAN